MNSTSQNTNAHNSMTTKQFTPPSIREKQRRKRKNATKARDFATSKNSPWRSRFCVYEISCSELSTTKQLAKASNEIDFFWYFGPKSLAKCTFFSFSLVSIASLKRNNNWSSASQAAQMRARVSILFDIHLWISEREYTRQRLLHTKIVQSMP